MGADHVDAVAIGLLGPILRADRAAVEPVVRTWVTDDDRWPWLGAMRDWMSGEAKAGRSTVVTCSALKRSYRDLLDSAEGDVRFVHLSGDTELIRERMKTRSGHFMPASLLPSQLATLEPLQPDEPGVVVPAVGTPEDVERRALTALGLHAPGAGR